MGTGSGLRRCALKEMYRGTNEKREGLEFHYTPSSVEGLVYDNSQT